LHLRRKHKNPKKKTSLGKHPAGVAVYERDRKMK